MSKKVVIVTGLCLLVVVAGSLFVWQRSSSSAPDQSATSRCPDGANEAFDKTVEDMGGQERAANMGISSTLERCIE